MARRQPLVAEHAPDLIDALEATHQQALQVQLKRDPQVEVAIERVVMRLKRTRVAAARNLLEDRTLHVDETPLVEQAADRGDDPGSRPKDVPYLRVGDEVHVSLPVADLDVLQAVPLLRHRPERLGQQLERLNLDRDLSSLGPKNGPDHPDDVADVEVREARELLVAEDAAVGHQLDPTLPVLKVGEDETPLLPLHHQPAGDRDGRRALGVADELLGGDRAMRRLEAARVRIDPGRSQPFDLLEPVVQEVFRHDRKRVTGASALPLTPTLSLWGEGERLEG